MGLGVVVLPVADVDRAKSFYQSLGWRLDADASAGDDFRVVQLTPPASNASIIFGKGITSAQPGSIDSLFLAVDDIDAARDELLSHGVEVSEVCSTTPAPGTRVGVRGAAPGPGVTDGRCGSCTAPALDGRPPRLVRGGRPTARLVGLVRGIHARARNR
ncbi:MAG: VOC family protein [Solirubrobacteraceae bacterium]